MTTVDIFKEYIIVTSEHDISLFGVKEWDHYNVMINVIDEAYRNLECCTNYEYTQLPPQYVKAH